MTRRDYKLFASMIAVEVTESLDIDSGARLAIKRYIADVFERDNPMFDRSRFYAACDQLPIMTNRPSCIKLVLDRGQMRVKRAAHENSNTSNQEDYENYSD